MNPYWRYMRQMWRAHRVGLSVALMFAFLSAGGFGAGILAVKPMFEVMFDPEGGRSLGQLAVDWNAGPDRLMAIPAWLVEWLPTDPFDGMVVIVIGLALLTIVGAITNFMHQYISQTITTRAVADIRREAFENVLHLGLSDVVARGPTEFVARIVRDAAELQKGLISLVSKSVTHVTKGSAAFAVALILDWQLTIISIVVAPILAVALRKLGKRIRRGTKGSLEAQEDLLRVSTESLQGLRAVKVNTAEPIALSRFDEKNADVIHHELRVRTARALSAPLVETLALLAILGLALVATKAILRGTLTPDSFILTFGALGIAGGAFRPLAGLINEIQAASAPAERLAEISDIGRERDAGTSTLPRHAKSVAFENISFRYPGADHPTLESVSLEIAHGTRVAIVGPNGSGKTTLLGLLPRLLRPSSGRICIDGVDIDSVTLHSLREQIGVVTQETVLFRGSVAENIAFGRSGATRAEIEDAARRAHADGFIQELRGGYDADIAEQGASLSGGQRQRLAIARALLRDPAILVLDEATSQIDPESETHIGAALREFSAGRTVFVIAHRLSTVRDADLILVMDAGCIVDRGSHDELLKSCPLYTRLCGSELGEERARDADASRKE